jgi:flagellar motor protein MotB
VTCSLVRGTIQRCDATLIATVAGRPVVVGRGTTTTRGPQHRATVQVTLAPLGRALARRVGGRMLRAVVRITADGAVLNARVRARVVAASVPAPQPVLFATASAALRSGAIDRLTRLRRRLTQVRAISCTGFTDSRSSTRFNRMLAAHRARAVCAFLDRGGIRAVVIGHGETSRFAANTNARGRQLNRRAEIRLIYG